MKKIDDEEPDLILIQETYEYQNRITGIAQKYRIFTAGTGKHKAVIIIINSNISAFLITKLSDEDTALEEIIHEKWKFFTASMYFDLEDEIENNFNKMDELMRFVKCGRILIAVDSNSRSKTWNDSKKKNALGTKMEEYLVSKHTHIVNEESERPNFFNSRGSSNIDLTIANNNLVAEVTDLEISNEDSLSDHNYIQYKISKGGDCNQNNSNTARV